MGLERQFERQMAKVAREALSRAGSRTFCVKKEEIVYNRESREDETDE